MVFDYLSIPSMSNEYERSFSFPNRVLGNIRYSLNDETLYKLLCMRAWNRIE